MTVGYSSTLSLLKKSSFTRAIPKLLCPSIADGKGDSGILQRKVHLQAVEQAGGKLCELPNRVYNTA